MVKQEVTGLCAAYVKTETRVLHEEAEKVMMPLIKAAVSIDKYGALLQQLYGFYKPMEQLLAPEVAALGLPLSSFQRTHLLEQDIVQIGVHQPTRFCQDLPAVQNKLQALGAIYVLEGAALGGRIIARMLQSAGTLPEDAFCFFKGRGEDTGAHWKQFTQLLNQHAVTENQMRQVSDAACATFDKHTSWMKSL